VNRIPIQGRNYFRPKLTVVCELLGEASLPAEDLADSHMEHFIACGNAEALAGVVGLELYPPCALLRSLAVAASERGNGVGSALLADAERYARCRGITEIYLLTNTAERFFERNGYQRLSKEAAPTAIRETQEFATLCPASSALMRKVLR
jgi:amino-acid N-acetyltransferase